MREVRVSHNTKQCTIKPHKGKESSRLRELSIFIISKDTLINSSDYNKKGQSKQLNLFSSILCLQQSNICC